MGAGAVKYGLVLGVGLVVSGEPLRGLLRLRVCAFLN